MKKTRRRGDAGTRSKKGDVVLTRRQAEFVMDVIWLARRKYGFTPMEKMLMGAIERRVEAAKNEALR